MNFRNECGSFLLTILIATVILGFVVLYFLRSFSTTSDAIRYSELGIDRAIITRYLVQNTDCKATLEPSLWKMEGGTCPASQPVELKRYKDPKGEVEILLPKTGRYYGGRSEDKNKGWLVKARCAPDGKGILLIGSVTNPLTRKQKNVLFLPKGSKLCPTSIGRDQFVAQLKTDAPISLATETKIIDLAVESDRFNLRTNKGCLTVPTEGIWNFTAEANLDSSTKPLGYHPAEQPPMLYIEHYPKSGPAKTISRFHYNLAQGKFSRGTLNSVLTDARPGDIVCFMAKNTSSIGYDITWSRMVMRDFLSARNYAQ